MKLTVNRKYNTSPEYSLKIIIEFGTDEYREIGKIAASTYLHHPSISRKSKITDNQLEELDNLIGSVLHVLETFSFDVTRSEQSSKSYSYYIDFIPVDTSGSKWEYAAEIQFELRDHATRDHGDAQWIGPELYVKVFHVGKNKVFNLSGVVSEVKKICGKLQRGDYSDLEPIPTNSRRV